MKKDKVSLMNKKEAIVIGVIIVIMVIILLVVINVSKNKNTEDTKNLGSTGGEDNYVEEEFVERMEDGTRVNTSSKLAETKKSNGYEISNITLTEKGNLTSVRATITNTTSQKRGDEPIYLEVIDKNGNVLTEIEGYLDTLQPGASSTLKIDTTADFANAYDYRIK